MNESANSNMYEVNAESVLAAYGDFVQGTPEATLLAVATAAPSEAARAAVEGSARQLGFNAGACAWLVLATDGVQLGPEEAGTVTEGLDPLAIAVFDGDAAGLFGQAYRCELPLDAATRVKGRTVAAFRSFEAMLADADQKQKAWALLKKLRTA